MVRIHPRPPKIPYHICDTVFFYVDEDGFGTEGKKDDSANRLYRGGLPDSLQFFDLTYPCEHKIVDEDGFGAKVKKTIRRIVFTELDFLTRSNSST